MTFEEWKNGEPAQDMFRKLGLSHYLDVANSWSMLRYLIVDFNDPDRGNFVKLAKRCDSVCSSGERVLLHAILHATDFSWLADKLGGRKVWQDMEYVSGDHRKAVAACIAQA